MLAYIARRIFQALLILVGVSLITFALLYVLPADPVRQIAGRSATSQTVENIRHQLGLDQPFLVQYGRYLLGHRPGRFRPLLSAADGGRHADRRRGCRRRCC